MIHISLVCLGFTSRQWECYIAKRERQERCSKYPLPSPIPKAEFRKSYTIIPDQENYSGEFEETYWNKWIKRSYADLRPFKSWIFPEKLLRVATRIGHDQEDPQLQRVLQRLKEGADIGCRGGARKPTEHQNSRSSEEFGNRRN